MSIERATVLRIRALAASGLGAGDIAYATGLSKAAIRSILSTDYPQNLPHGEQRNSLTRPWAGAGLVGTERLDHPPDPHAYEGERDSRDDDEREKTTQEEAVG